MLAKIAVSAAVFAIDKPYDYRIPDGMPVQPGMRVTVPFGRGDRITEGVVLTLEDAEPGPGVKSIQRCLDPEPVLTEPMLRLAAFVRQRYYCTFFEAIRVMLPAGLWFRSRDTYVVAQPLAEDWPSQVARMEGAQTLLRTILELGGRAELSRLERDFDADRLQKLLRYLVGKGLLINQTDLQRKVTDKTELVVQLAVSAGQAMAYAAKKKKSAPLQHAVLELLCQVGSAGSKDLCYLTGAGSATLKRLAELGFVELSVQPVLRCPEFAPVAQPPELTLTPDQQSAFDRLLAQLASPEPGTALLYGVTGAGKTSVYLKLIAACLARGRSALILVPEIGLTPQLLQRFAAWFGDKVALLHSGLRVGERYDQWRRIRSGDARVVLGTRSAVFAPLENPGLIILDEEQEHTYKSENTPRYHAREVAQYRGLQQKALVLLGSATPSVETMYHARCGQYLACTLPERYHGALLPQVTLVDMKQELKAGNGSPISRRLRQEITENLRRGEQTILFLNRRGSSRMTVCVDCGFVPQCPNCSVRLTYHSANGRLMCHYCGHSVPMPAACPACGSGHLKQVGFGTQRLEQELARLFPEAGILRMDADTVSAANTHERILERFVRERVPILIGTQMVSKGLDFENVTLVGVLDADQSLYIDSYRAPENTFSMLTQVVGRAGRGEKPGRAVVQTMTPQHPVLNLAARQDYDGFFAMELSMRRVQRTPPFGDLILLHFSGPVHEQVLEAARKARRELQPLLEQTFRERELPQLLGPAPAAVAKVSNRYRYRLTLRGKNSKVLRQLLSDYLRRFSRDKGCSGVHMSVDCNPFDC